MLVYEGFCMDVMILLMNIGQRRKLHQTKTIRRRREIKTTKICRIILKFNGELNSSLGGGYIYI